jgi:hypothetical protein
LRTFADDMRALRPSTLAILLVVTLTAVLAVQWLWKGPDGQGWKEIVRSDAKGYYGYLTATFIRHDLGQEPHACRHTEQVLLRLFAADAALVVGGTRPGLAR